MELIAGHTLRSRTGEATRDLVRRQQGATQRTLDVLEEVIGSKGFARQAA